MNKCFIPSLEFIAGFLFVSLFFSNNLRAQYCTDDNRFAEVEYFSINQIDSVFDISYGSVNDWLGEELDLQLDIYFPSSDYDSLSQRPFVMMIHGGAFVGGNKSGLRKDCRELAKRGFVAATISYRLGYDLELPNSQFLAVYRAVQDANAAFRYIDENSSDYSIDTSWMFAGGLSAGSYTVLGAHYYDQEDMDSFIPGIGSLLGGINDSGNDLTNTFSIKGNYNSWGALLISSMQIEELIPTISFHGVLDETVLIGLTEIGIGGSAIVDSLLNENGVCSELVIDSLGGHGIYGGSTISGSQFRSKRASCFFKSIFCDNCSSEFITEPILPTCSSDLSSINNLTSSSSIDVYPNPFSDSFKIEGLEGTNYFTLYNSTGQKIEEGDNISDFEMSFVPNGIYFLSIQSNNFVRSVKLVKL